MMNCSMQQMKVTQLSPNITLKLIIRLVSVEISKLEAADHLELLNLSEQLAQVERELAHQQSENNNLDQILAE